jgi:hypothetical protein
MGPTRRWYLGDALDERKVGRLSIMEPTTEELRAEIERLRSILDQIVLLMSQGIPLGLHFRRSLRRILNSGGFVWEDKSSGPKLH